MAKDKDAQDVLNYLKSLGYEGELIDETAEKTPDMWVSDERHKYVIEVKSKSEAPDKIANRHSVLMEGQIFEETTPIVPKNTIDRIIVDGCKQLSSSDTGDFYILWMKFKSFDSQKDMEIAKQTVLGIQNVWDVTNDHNVLPCYYFKNSSFYRSREILDGVIFEYDGSGEFWINNFSPRYEKLKLSNFIKHFPPNDPLEKACKGDAYIVDGDADRSDESKVLAYLMKKYNSKNIKPFIMSHVSGVIKMDNQ